jgi:membrane protease YdiL (CAAX protease family)/tetratricopeptide (TPR) repeat protein
VELVSPVAALLWAQGLSWLLTLRIAAAVAIFPLLYRALGEPGQGWGGGHPVVFRRVFFAALGSFVAFTLTANWIPEERAPSQGRAFQAFATGVMHLRLAHTPMAAITAAEDGDSAQDQALKDLRKAVELVPESVHFRRYLGVALAHAGRYPEAVTQLGKAMDLLAQRAAPQADRERRVWRTLFSGETPTPDDLRQASDEVERLRLGWIGRVAVLAAARRLGPKAVPADLEERVTTEASDFFRRVILAGTFALLIVPQLGLIVLAVGFVLIKTGVLAPVRTPLHDVNPVLWESFILMMALGVTPVLWLLGGKRPSPETSPGQVAVLLVFRDVLQLGAIAYLWYRLRQRGLTLAEIGLERQGLLGHIAVGVLAALVMLPCAYLVNWLTQTLSDRFFPNIAPPYHPLQGMTATSGSPEIRIALFVAAVIGAPLLEEIFFRGALYGGLRRKYGVALGIVASSAFFAILHPQLPLGFLPIAFLGATFCVLYEWRRSLVPGMVAHAVNNGVAFLMLNLLFPRQS